MSNVSENKKIWLNVCIVTTSTIFSLLFAEILSRFLIPPAPTPKGTPYFYNFIDKEIYKFGVMKFHEELGWVSKPGTSGYSLFGEFQSFDSMGLRNNDNTIPLQQKPLILAVGDSYTFGSEINNNETWPSQLEKSLGIKVINGGMGGYGFGQMLTRARILLKKIPADILIVAVISSSIDVRVKQTVRHGLAKPYYTIEKSGDLVFHKVSPSGAQDNKDFFKNIFGYSYILHLLLSKFFPVYWLEGSIFDMQSLDINEITLCNKITNEYAKLVQDNQIQHFILALLPASAEDISLIKHPVSKYAKAIAEKNERISVVDIQSILLQQYKKLQRQKFFNDIRAGYHGHYSKEGAKLI